MFHIQKIWHNPVISLYYGLIYLAVSRLRIVRKLFYTTTQIVLYRGGSCTFISIASSYFYGPIFHLGLGCNHVLFGHVYVCTICIYIYNIQKRIIILYNIRSIILIANINTICMHRVIPA